MNPDCERAYTRYLEDHHGDLSDIENLAETLFNAGGRTMMACMTEFSDVTGLLNRVHEKTANMLVVLERIGQTRTADHGEAWKAIRRA